MGFLCACCSFLSIWRERASSNPRYARCSFALAVFMQRFAFKCALFCVVFCVWSIDFKSKIDVYNPANRVQIYSGIWNINSFFFCAPSLSLCVVSLLLMLLLGEVRWGEKCFYMKAFCKRSLRFFALEIFCLWKKSIDVFLSFFPYLFSSANFLLLFYIACCSISKTNNIKISRISIPLEHPINQKLQLQKEWE